LILILFQGFDTFATHIKAGEIVATRISNSTYRIQLYLYTDSTSVIRNGVDEPQAFFTISDGTTKTVPRDAPGIIFIGNNTVKSVYTFIHTFNSGNHTVSYQMENRNGGILNMDNSGKTPFYVQTTIRVGTFLSNNLPALTVPPLDLGVVGQVYTYNPGAFDLEGDSLSYSLVTPKQNVGVNVAGYQHPNAKPVSFGSFTLDPITGDLVWDAPLVPGLYNFAILISEHRRGFTTPISTIVRDMQIEIKESLNKKPIVKIPNDTCVVAGTALTNIAIVATDPKLGDRITLTSTSGIYSLLSSPGSFTQNLPKGNPASGMFNWITNCSHIRSQPYLVTFIAEDIPVNPPKLFDQKSWYIKVLGPKPTGLVVNSIHKGLELNWNAYSCSNADKMEIFRKSCDSSDYVPGPCDEGVPAYTGYIKVGEVPIGTTNYKDTVNIIPGSFYCYMISAAFPAPKGGNSYASEEVCGLIDGQPIPTNVSVLKTDSVNGKIMVKWTKPKNLNTTEFPGPYEYRLFRATGMIGTDFLPIDTLTVLSDTVVIDSLINTRDTSYNYKVQFYYTGANGLTLKNASMPFSSVFLKSTPGGNKVNLSWTYDVPWNNQDQLHRIYKKNASGVFELLDELLVTGLVGSYIDTDVINGDTSCYYIETTGRYCSDDMPHPLINNSQIVCEVPRDTLPPCPPSLFGPQDCIEDGITQLKINWTPDFSNGCNKDISGYNVYYAEREDEELLLFASNVADTFFVDTDNFSLAGCYAVTALNYYGAESAKSNKVCVDLCVDYELPNLISPNRDNFNDVFIPLRTPKNVHQVKFEVFNRWGKRVYYSEDDVKLNWPGDDTDGKILASGIYYFHAVVIYKRRLRKENDIKNIKGWVHIIRKEEGDIQE
jgi:gliding motility-associated-like protein